MLLLTLFLFIVGAVWALVILSINKRTVEDDIEQQEAIRHYTQCRDSQQSAPEPKSRP